MKLHRDFGGLEQPIPNGLVQNQPLIDTLLMEQQQCSTAVVKFADWHQEHLETGAKVYRDLIPLTKPGTGEQYAFEVDLDRCTGCKACVVACHSLNGLDDDESWRDAGLLLGGSDVGYQQTVTTACHHCVDPACANGCPVLAYEKDPESGIVRHLDDQCIGCSYCILKCPYDAPKFNRKRGIVRKCDLCHGRLAEGQRPACVSACPNGAISVKIVKRDAAPPLRLVPGAFESDYTKPTTRYISRILPPADAVPGGNGALMLDDSHVPLIWMLVLTQLAAGGAWWTAVASWMGHPAAFPLSVFSVCFCAAGIIASICHLGQPLKAWRAFLGWRKSWLSREIIAFGAAAGAAAFVPATIAMLPLLTPAAALGSAVVMGFAIFCSAMIYIDTRRPFWNRPLVLGKFSGTALLLGSGLAAAVLAQQRDPQWAVVAGLAVACRWGLSLWEMRGHRAALSDASCPWHRPARLMAELQPVLLRWRFALLLVIGALLPLLAAVFPSAASPMLGASLLLNIASQWMERYQFFTCAARPKMPGVG